MRASRCLFALIVIVWTAPYGAETGNEKRDAALKGIEACFQRNRDCKVLEQNLMTLEDLYRQGDKTVLPTLLRYGAPGNFIQESLIADPDAFLSAVAGLPEPDQRAAFTYIAGGWFGLDRAEFDATRTALRSVPDSSPARKAADACLRILEANNATLLLSYFPPATFPGRDQDLLVHWYSADLYALGEKPLTDLVKNPDADAYRLMVLPTWGNAIAIEAQRCGSAYCLTARRLNGEAGFEIGKLVEARDVTLDSVDSSALEALIQGLKFFQMPEDDHVLGFDGDEWILEGVAQGQYHLADRWSATTIDTKARGLTAFVALCRFLVEKSQLSQGPKNKGDDLLK